MDYCETLWKECVMDHWYRWYRGVLIHPKNYAGMYSARVDVPGGKRLAADTLAGIKELIRTELSKRNA